jgi:putative ABC transport system permease protein
VEERIRFGILLGHGEKTVPAFGFGIDLDASRFRIPEKLAGKQPAEAPTRPLAPGLYLGKTLFARLGLAEGEELLLVTRTSEGGLNGIKLPVRAAVSFGVSMIDEKCFFLPVTEARRLLRLHDASLGLYVFGNGDPAALATAITEHLPEGVIAQTRREQAPAIDDMFRMSKSIMWFIEAFILFLASFVVINTMLMAVYERMREIGAVKALGMKDSEVFRQFTLEGALIGAAGGLAGVAVGAVVLLALSGSGINLADAFSNVDMPIEYVVRPAASPGVFVTTVLLSILVPALAAAIPARKARKLAPAEALRRI